MRALVRTCAVLAVVLCLLPSAAAAAAETPATGNTGEAGEADAQEKKRPDTFDEWMALARNGDLEAQCNVGVFYVNGREVPQDYKLGLEWLGRSADAGFDYAQYVLANLYSKGIGEQQPDNYKAYYWASLAAAIGDMPDQYQQKAAKIREASKELLDAAQLSKVQAETREWWAKYKQDKDNVRDQDTK